MDALKLKQGTDGYLHVHGSSASFLHQQKLRSLNLHVGLDTRGLYSRCIFTAEVIPYQEHWKRTTKVEL